MTPAQFGKLVADETEKWSKVVKAANISVEEGFRRLRAFPSPACGRGKEKNTSWRECVNNSAARWVCSRAADLGPANKSADAYFFMCLVKKSVVRCHARSRPALL